MSKLLLVMIVLLLGCTQEPRTCEYTHLDRNDLQCISIPAAKWNYKDGEIGDIFIEDICKGRYKGKWVYSNTDLSLIEETVQNGSFLGKEIQFITAYGQVSQWTCYYYNVE